jgi:hypothetical protein
MHTITIDIIPEKKQLEHCLKPESEDIDQFYKFVTNLNLSGMEPFLSEDVPADMFEDKYFVLSVLRDMFEHCTNQGVTHFKKYESKCTFCDLGCSVSVFEGIDSELHFALVPVKNDKDGLSFHFCWGYTNEHGAPFKKVPLIDFWGNKSLEYEEKGFIDLSE